MGGIVLFIAIAFIISVIFNFFTRKQVLDSGPIDEHALEFLKTLSPFGYSNALKWGILALFGGAGLVLIEFLPYKLSDSPLPYGVEPVFLGIGFLVYHLVSRTGNR